MPDAVLALNAGSSSVKFALFELADGDGLARALKGEVEYIGGSPRFSARDAGGRSLGGQQLPAGATHQAFLAGLLDFVEQRLGTDRLIAVGHRVVHGGTRFTAPARVTDDVLAALEALVPLAPLHQPHNIAPIRAVAAHRPALPQVVCFDTAFHQTMPAVATRFALPRSLEQDGVRRYGFHGLSYEYIAGHLRETSPTLAQGRMIVAHLGNGASLCALRDGHSVETTMSFTALDGLVMGTRCGSIDPGVLLYLQQQRGMRAAEVEDLLYHRSGLLGVSGISNDMRALLASADPCARDAVELFVYRIACETGALASALGGLDGFVFTAGIGEHAAAVRELVCARLAWLGVQLDLDANQRGAGRITTLQSPVDVRVIPTDEEAMIARHTIDTMRA